MKFFLDTANLDAIKKAVDLGMCDGITTNPTLVAKEMRKHDHLISEIAKIVKGPISVEGDSDTCEGIVKEAHIFRQWATNVVVKVPMTHEGLKAVRILEKEGIPTNVTLVFSPSQALLAAKAGASYVSPFVGRLDDISENGMQVVRDILEIYGNYNFKTQVIVASVRSTSHVVEAAKAGAHVATIPADVLSQMWHHPLTDKGIAKFKEDFKKTSELKK